MLIGYLLCERNAVASRSRIAGAIWPDKDEDAARHCLASTLWRTKRVFDGRADPIATSGDAIALEDTAWVDARAFERRARRCLSDDTMPPARAAHGLSAALRLYSGAFLTSADADWILLERERLDCLRLDALHGLARLQAQTGAWSAALASGQALCALEPLREDGHRIVMEAHAAMGNRGLAIRQYRTCADVLARELGVDPMPETQALVRRLSGEPAAMVPAAELILRKTLMAVRGTLLATVGSIDAALAEKVDRDERVIDR